MRIAMIGSGYVGLVSGACFADFGHIVTCIDKDPDKIAALSRGEMPIYEPGLAELVAKNVREERLFFTTCLDEPAKAAEALFIAVGTPSRRGDGHADLTYVFNAAREIATVLNGYKVIVTKSTVPVGTGDEVARIIAEARPDAEFAVVSNPEFLREGAAIADFKRPDRIVVGTDDERARTSSLPMTIRSGCLKSWIAAPSRRNSGLETTGTAMSGRSSRRIRSTSSPVPIGTVDLVTTTVASDKSGASWRAAA